MENSRLKQKNFLYTERLRVRSFNDGDEFEYQAIHRKMTRYLLGPYAIRMRPQHVPSANPRPQNQFLDRYHQNARIDE